MSFSATVGDWVVERCGEEGPYHATVFFAVATNGRGDRFAHFHTFNNADDCWALVEKMNDRGFDPVDSDYWNRMDPVYGSEAYQRNPTRTRSEEFAALGMHDWAEREALAADEAGVSGY